MDISQVKKLIENLHSLPNGKYFRALAEIKTVMAQKAVTTEQPKTYGDVIVINESNEILLVQRNANDDFMPNKWWMPGGKIEQGESNAVGAARELSEEVGIHANPSDLVFLESKNLDNGGTSHRFALSVKDNASIKLQAQELQNHTWVSRGDLYRYDLLGSDIDLKQLIDKALNPEPPKTATTEMFNRHGIKPTNRNGNVDVRARQKANDEAIALLNKIQNEGLTRDDLTTEQLETLAKYTGNGGGVVNHEGKKGSQYEYYTPMELASSMWDLAKELGFNGGRVLDPSAGTGVFTSTSPQNAIIDSVELDQVSGGIAKVLNDGARSHTVVSPFEKEAGRIADNSVDMVITNVPFGQNSDRGANKMLDKAYQNESLENYFILRSLEKLKHGGLAVFVTPTNIVSGKQQSNIKLRQKASLKAEFLGAYRLPNSMFDETGADVVTDVIAFRKYSEDASTTINDLYDNDGIDTLTSAGVLFDDFINGKYFLAEGKRFVLGEIQETTNKYGGLTEKVFTTKSNADIAKMLRKFGDSRINWDLLNAAEPTLIEYKNGDVIFQNGKQLTYQDGVWVETETEVTDTDRQMQDLLANMKDAYTVAVNDVTWDDVIKVLAYSQNTGQRGLIPYSLEDLITSARKQVGNESVAWKVLMTAKAIDKAFDYSGYGYDYVANEPALTQAMKNAFLDGKNSNLVSDAKQAHKYIAMHYNKGNYSTAWRGEVDNEIGEVELVNYQDKIAKMQYENKSLYITREQFNSVHPDIDPLKNDDWFVKANGDVIHANDFLVSKLSDRLSDIDKEIEKATDGSIKAKLIKQKTLARDAIIKTNVRAIDYSLRSPLIDAETKVKFLQTQPDIGSAAKVSFDENGRPIADIDIKNAKYDKQKLLNRFGDWLNKGTVTLGGISISLDEREALEWLSDRINTANVEFETWLKANDKIMDALNERINSDENLYFSQNSDERAVEIAGMNPALNLHGYQNAFVRAQGRFFGGINGFGVGLGKAQPLTAKILTPNGWKLMGDMQIGDEVIAYDGTISKVTGVFPQGEKDIFEVVFSDGAKTQCCDEHLWLTETENDRKKSFYHKSQGLIKQFNSVKQLSEIRQTLIYGKKQKNHKIPMVGMIDMPTKKLSIDPYLLGILLGDGGLSGKSIIFTTPEREIVDKVTQLVSRDLPKLSVNKRKVVDRCNSYGICTSDNSTNELTEKLKEFGLMGCVSDTKFVPSEYLTSSYEQRLALFHGLMDTDGYVSKDGITVQYYSTSDNLANSMIELVQSFGGIAWKAPKQGAYKKDGIKIECKDCWIVSIRMPSNINPFTLTRKAERVTPKSKYMPVRYFVEVNPIGRAQAQCIAIDHPEHLYITDGYIVTHNTFTALASVQHVQNIGAKKKTIFVVPNSVLSNWRKEATHAYTSMDDCLFIGLREKGDGFRVYSSLYDEDLTQAIDKQYRKIFMTYEAFKRIRLKDDTLESYADYLQKTDSGYAASESKKKDERSKGNLAGEIEKVVRESNAPYLEDMNIDSIVVDEAHAFKNSITAPETEKGIKYLSTPNTSIRGDDAQAKMWYVRDLSANKDGVQLLTATPITNSPLEIYSMLCLTAGREQVNAMCGNIRGADDFLKVMCNIAEETVPTIDGRARSQNVFIGIQNGNMLRTSINQIATVKDAKDVGMSVVIPSRDETSTKVALNKHTVAELVKMQKAYRIARLLAKEKVSDAKAEMLLDSTLEPAYNEIKEKFGEEDALLGHPFNLIRKMDIMIADDDFGSFATFYDFDPAQTDLAQKAVDLFTKKKIREERTKLSEFTNPDNAAEIHKKDGDSYILTGYKITVESSIVSRDGRDRIVIDTMDSLNQSVFESIADNLGLKLNVTVSAKVAAMLDNFKQELANPRGIKNDGTNSRVVKQIIFCDHLFLHNKIKRLLTQQCGISAEKIVVITGQVNNEPDAIIDIQEGFNGFDEENRYQVIIANKKAEVGINLQRGTQAIHHLTTGWTPDSLEQRNGRGARQGNLTGTVIIYHYDADGTFDEFKRAMINKKDEWISNVLSSEGKNKIAVSGGISQSEQDALIRTMGDTKAMAEYQAKKDELEKQERLAKAKKQQSINIGIIKTQFDVLQHAKVEDGYNADVKNAINIIRENINNYKAANDSKKSTATREKYQTKYQANKDSALTILQHIIDSVSYQTKVWNHITNKSVEGDLIDIAKTAEDIYQAIKADAKDFPPNKMDDRWNGWVSKFQGVVISNSSAEVVVKKDSAYQADFDEKLNTARNLIRVAKNAVNEVGSEYGGMVLPDDADQKMIDGMAKIEDGDYIEVGAIVIDNDNDGIYGVIDKELDYSYKPSYTDKIYSVSFRNQGGKKQVLLSTHPDYLTGVKALAKIEDALYATGVLRKDETGKFSAVIPMVAEYRDDNITVRYDIKPKFNVAHHELVNGTFPYVLPVSILRLDTDLTKALLDTYKKDGVNINLDEEWFDVNDDSAIVVRNNGKQINLYVPITDFIESNNISVDKKDIDIIDISVVNRFVKKPEGFLVTVRDALNALPDDFSDDDITALSSKLYNDHVNPDSGILDGLSDAQKDTLSYNALRIGASRNTDVDSFDFWFYLKDNAKRYKAKKAETANLQPSDTVAVTGNTKKWKQEIKDYASKHGTSINRSTRKYSWDGDNSQWLVSYQAYAKLVEDYPSAGNDLQIKKVA